MQTTSTISPTLPGRFFLSRSGRILSICLACVCTFLFIIAKASPRKSDSDLQMAKDSLVKVEQAALSGDKATMYRFCTNAFLLNASGANPGSKPSNVNWKKIKVWFMKRQGKWRIGHPFAPHMFPLPDPLGGRPLSICLYWNGHHHDWDVEFDAALDNLDNATS